MSLRRSPVLTPASLAARRSNARKSTGPRTVRGKARVSLNALKHGHHACRLHPRLLRADCWTDAALYRRLQFVLLGAFGPCGSGRIPRLPAHGRRGLVPIWRSSQAKRNKAGISFRFKGKSAVVPGGSGPIGGRPERLRRASGTVRGRKSAGGRLQGGKPRDSVPLAGLRPDVLGAAPPLLDAGPSVVGGYEPSWPPGWSA